MQQGGQVTLERDAKGFWNAYIRGTSLGAFGCESPAEALHVLATDFLAHEPEGDCL